MKGKLATKQAAGPQKPEPTEAEIIRQCVTELTAVLNKYGCILQVDFAKQQVMEKEVLAYGINVYKKK